MDEKELLKIRFLSDGTVKTDTDMSLSQVIAMLEEEAIYLKAKRKLKIEEQVKSDHEMMDKNEGI